MKKFLTVLLALSVVFTYSFSAVGSAFAATASEVAAERAKMESAVDAYVGSIGFNASGYVTSLPQSATTSIAVDSNITKAAVDAVAVVIKDKYNGEITKADAAGTDLDDAWEDINTSAKLETEFFTTQAVALYGKVIADVVKTFEAKVNGFAVNDYPTVDQKTVSDAVAAANAAITAAKGKNTKADSDKLHTAVGNFDDAVKELKTKAQREADLTAAKTAATSELDAKAAEFKPLAVTHYNDALATATDPEEIANAQAQKATLSTNINALVDMFKARIADVEYNDTKAYDAADANKGLVDAVMTDVSNAFDTAAFDKYEDAVSALNNAKILIEYAKSIATLKKQEYDPNTGLAKYNTETVEKALKKVTAAIYAGDITDTTGINTEFNNMKLATAIADDLAKAKEAAIKEITGTDVAKTYELAKWEGKNAEKVEAIQNEYVAKIEAATSEEDVTALATEAKGKMDKIADKTELTKAQIWDQLQALKYVNDSATKDESFASDASELGSLEVYANTIAAKNAAAQDKAKKAAVDTAIDALVEKAIAEFDATTEAAKKDDAVKAILQAGYPDALRMIDAMKTDAEIADAAKAISDAIAALPTNVTVDAKAQYLAVQKSLETYVNNKYPKADISNLSLFTAYMTKLVKLEKDAAQALISALPATATLADKATVDAAKAAADAYKETYGAYGAGDYNYGYGELTTTRLDAAVEAVANAMVVDAAKKIAALPVTVTADDKAAVEAARAAYDALTDAQKAVFNKDLLAKLEAAEATLKTAEEDAIKDVINAVQSFKIKVTTKRYTGSKMRINWTATGDESAIDGYRVYYSTKKSNSGYKYLTKTTKKYINHTSIKKTVKKGTRVYYRVRAYAEIDGVRYFSDYSTVGNRIWK